MPFNCFIPQWHYTVLAKCLTAPVSCSSATSTLCSMVISNTLQLFKHPVDIVQTVGMIIFSSLYLSSACNMKHKGNTYCTHASNTHPHTQLFISSWITGEKTFCEKSVEKEMDELVVNAACRGDGAVVKGELLILGLTCLPAAFWLHRGDGVKGQNRGLNHAANTFPWICHCFPLGWNGYRGNNSYVLTWNQYSSSLFGNIVLINDRTLKIAFYTFQCFFFLNHCYDKLSLWPLNLLWNGSANTILQGQFMGWCDRTQLQQLQYFMELIRWQFTMYETVICEASWLGADGRSRTGF